MNEVLAVEMTAAAPPEGAFTTQAAGGKVTLGIQKA